MSNTWDLTWFDSKNKEQKRQHCSVCNKNSKYVSFSDIEGIYSNRVFGGTSSDVYWTPWPLPDETPGLFYLEFKKSSTGKRKSEGESSHKVKQVKKGKV